MGINSDQYWMQFALEQAQLAFSADEVPIGAILVQNEEIIAVGYNQCLQLHDATAHAEIMAIRQAGQRLQNYRLQETTLYVTVEPCAMCTAAMINARIYRLVFGCNELKTGACVSNLQLAEANYINHKMLVTGGVLAKSSAALLTDFFATKRRL